MFSFPILCTAVVHREHEYITRLNTVRDMTTYLARCTVHISGLLNGKHIAMYLENRMESENEGEGEVRVRVRVR